MCTGYGGIELGLRGAGMDVRTVCYLEIEVYVQALLVKAMEEGRLCTAPLWSDVKTFPSSEFRGKVCGIVGGYPCQPFSSSGKRQGEEDPRHLWPHIRRHIRAISPVWCFFENVLGHTSMGLWRVLSDLEAEGYRCVWGVFSAEEVGAPHQRKRVFILAVSEGRESGESETGDRRESVIRGSKEMGDTTGKRSCGGSKDKDRQWSKVFGKGFESLKFPSRPNEEQYEWEAPRTIKSRLGRTIDGTSHRVDRLRLLGNGVVPQTAEIAWRTLWEKLSEQS
jgi:DNA (cytosine-5)-methyltransferase 1